MLIDTFLFSDAHESDLLFLKLTLEHSYVDKFILQECSYNFKGEPKGLFANEVLSTERFIPFRDKIEVVSFDNTINQGYTDEHNNFIREKAQRTLCHNVLQQYPDDTLILISDTDEMIDFSDDNRKQRFIDNVCKDRPSWVLRRRYWYDYDNECRLRTIRIPILPLSIARHNPDAIYQSRHYHDDARVFGTYEDPIAFEYSYVFKSKEGIFDKKKNYSHTGFNNECVQGGLYLNCWPRSKSRGEKINPEVDFFEKIELTEQNSPKYIRDNLEQLKTNIVDPNYLENRKNWTSEFTEKI